MILDFIAIGVIIVCLGGVIYLISKKFPIISSIDIQKLSKHKQEKVKSELMEGRLKRKLEVFNIKKYFEPSGGESTGIPVIQKIRNFLKEMEQRYQKKVSEAEVEELPNEKRKTILLAEAESLADKDQDAEAEQKFIEAISLDARYKEAYHGLADLYLKKKDYDHAKEIFKYLIKINATDDTSYEHLGQIAKSQGDLAEAEKDYLQSISLNNRVAGYQVDLAEVYQAKGEQDKALEHFQEALKLEPNNPRYLDLAIEMAIALEKPDVARPYIDKLKEVNPDNKKLKEYRKVLSKAK
ncbi:MAG: tetratricopeptide repeat protein [Patescibacteria group bacterium]|jgi:tetratricopeptide (TPR) repeat protein